MGKVLMKIENGKLTRMEEETPAQKRAGKRRMKEICEARCAPGFTNGDDALSNRYGTLRKQLGDQTDMVIAAARAKGYNPSPNDIYMPTMCRPIGAAGGKGGMGDPIAFIPQGSGARKTMKDRIEKHFGTETDGWVKTKETFRDRRESVLPKQGLSADIVQDLYAEKVLENPGLLDRDENEVKAEIRLDHGGASKDKDAKEDLANARKPNGGHGRGKKKK